MKKFILGLGAQRAATTSVHNYLKKSDLVEPPFIKEMHIWDALEIKECSKWRESIQKFSNTNDNLTYLKKLRMFLQNDTNLYFEYFDKLLKKNNKKITYDLSPTYMGLNKNTLLKINEGFKNLDIECKYLLIIRDPIDRCWSAVKYFQKKFKNGTIPKDQNNFNPLLRESVITNISAENALEKYINSYDAKFRTAYEVTINNILKVLPKEKLLVLIFENLNQKSFFNEINNFLNIDESKYYVSEKINTSTEDLLTNINLKKKIVSNFKSTYLFCKKHFPETKKLWEGIKYLDDL